LYVEVEDINGEHPSENTVVDTFSIDIDTSTPISTFTTPTWYNGTFHYASIQLSYQVDCVNFYYLSCDSTCEAARNCSCIPGFSGNACERNTNDCLNATCPANSVCVDAINSYTCDCLEGFSGENCTSDHPDTTTAFSLTTTTEPPPVCSAGFTGPTCDENINDCQDITCSGKGECIDHINGYTCNCPLEYTGADCETRTDHCLSVVCAHGRCVNGQTCTCDPGFTGIHCEIRTDDCYRVTCSGRGVCVDEGNFYTCICEPGYQGINCEVETNECARITCNGHGKCHDGLEQLHCECDPDYTGLLCETKIDNCLLANCSATEECVDGVNGFHCDCKPGYTGDMCDVQGCADVDCNGNGACNATSFSCDCFKGYSGKSCEVFTSKGKFTVHFLLVLRYSVLTLIFLPMA
jgi:Notch-like protein